MGKTAIAIALIIHQKLQGSHSPVFHSPTTSSGGTLIVVPAPLVDQWIREIEKFCQAGLLKVFKFLGKRDISLETLATYDIVITSYKTLSKEIIKTNKRRSSKLQAPQEVLKESLLIKINWDRVILDEGHKIRNKQTCQSEAAFNLKANKHWILTGTPVHNSGSDLFALFKFIKVAPIDREDAWQNVIVTKEAYTHSRLSFLLSTFMLRRTKRDLKALGEMESLTEKNIEDVFIVMSQEQEIIHDFLMTISDKILQHLIYQEEGENKPEKFTKVQLKVLGRFGKSFKKMIENRNVSQLHFFAICIRLRQICCHPALMIEALNGGKPDEERSEAESEDEDVDLSSSESSDQESSNQSSQSTEERFESSDEGGVESSEEGSDSDDITCLIPNLSRDNPVFDREHPTPKIVRLMRLLKEIIRKGEKVLVVSYFVKFLEIIEKFINEEGIEYHFISGKVTQKRRHEMISDINDPTSSTQVALMSMFAGNLGLNIAGANNMIILDMNFNPQQELQVMDRIHRIGQLKDVNIIR